MAAQSCKVSFNVSTAARPLRAGESLHVCLAEPVTSGDSLFDPSKSVPLIKQEDSGQDSSGTAFSLWSTSKPVTVAWGVQFKYKYAIYANGGFSYWEKLTGDNRAMIPQGKVNFRTRDPTQLSVGKVGFVVWTT